MFKGLLNAYLFNRKAINLKEIKDKYTLFKARPQVISKTSRLVIGFSVAAVGCFGATKPNVGLNFKMTPHYSPNESYQNNLKAMVVAMMMTESLDKDEVTFLTNAVDALYSKEDDNSKNRGAWCMAEMKNYMMCAERYSSFQDDRCRTYQKMLKSCLQAKKGATTFVPTPSSGGDEHQKNSQCPAYRRHLKGLVLSTKPELDNCDVPEKPLVPVPVISAVIPVEKCDTDKPIVPISPKESPIPVETCDSPPPQVDSCEPIKLCYEPPKEQFVPVDICCPVVAPITLQPVDNCDPEPRPANACESDPTSNACEISIAVSTPSIYGDGDKTLGNEASTLSDDCDQICNNTSKGFGPEVDDATACTLEYEEWKQKQKCAC